MNQRRLPGTDDHHAPGFAAGRPSDHWSTPAWLLEALGPFDVDPCPLDPDVDGLTSDWTGFVWCNPPYSDVEPWIQRVADHGNGLVLVFSKTDTGWWKRWVWDRADGVLFIRGRLRFVPADPGIVSGWSSPGPSAVIAYGGDALSRIRALDRAGNGKLIVLGLASRRR